VVLQNPMLLYGLRAENDASEHEAFPERDFTLVQGWGDELWVLAGSQL
jgi:hypothetical protein